MAWDEGTMSQTAGALLTVLDTYLVANDYWSVYDASAGTNAKVYRNYDASANVDYYVKVDDNYTDYAIVELWEGWDSGSHAGIGNSLTTINTYSMYIQKPSGGYGIAVSNHRFVFIELTDGRGYYIGQLKRFDTSKNMPCAIVATSSSSGGNPIGYYNSSSTAGWACLFDEDGNVGNIIHAREYTSGHQTLTTIASTILIFETIIVNNATKKAMGQLENICRYHSSQVGLTNGQTVSLDGYEWLVVDNGTYGFLVKKA